MGYQRGEGTQAPPKTPLAWGLAVFPIRGHGGGHARALRMAAQARMWWSEIDGYTPLPPHCARWRASRNAFTISCDGIGSSSYAAVISPDSSIPPGRKHASPSLQAPRTKLFTASLGLIWLFLPSNLQAVYVTKYAQFLKAVVQRQGKGKGSTAPLEDCG